MTNATAPTDTTASPPAPKATPRRGAPATARQIAERLRERRDREVDLIVSASDALASRAAALQEAEAAGQVLTSAIRDLETMGFSRPDIAHVLDVTAQDLDAAVGPPKMSTARGNTKSGLRPKQ